MYGLFGYGVDEGDFMGEEGDAAVGVGTACTVFQVALDGAAHGGELAAYLVVAAREEVYL